MFFYNVSVYCQKLCLLFGFSAFIVCGLCLNSLAFCGQKPPCGGECLCCGVGQSGGLPGLPAPPPGLLQGHLGLPVLPGHC